tara:strand:- start:888 stop:998 length:111 start_codon:yes stop_codon:yes gene_type:complete
MMGLFLCMASFVIGYIYRNIRESDLRNMGNGADPGT